MVPESKPHIEPKRTSPPRPSSRYRFRRRLNFFFFLRRINNDRQNGETDGKTKETKGHKDGKPRETSHNVDEKDLGYVGNPRHLRKAI